MQHEQYMYVRKHLSVTASRYLHPEPSPAWITQRFASSSSSNMGDATEAMDTKTKLPASNQSQQPQINQHALVLLSNYRNQQQMDTSNDNSCEFNGSMDNMRKLLENPSTETARCIQIISTALFL